MQGQPAVIVLAAGSGSRFRAAGGRSDKLDAAFTRGGTTQTVRQHVLDAVRASGLRWHVVERHHTLHLEQPGMGCSIALGVAATADADGWLILPADLPLIRPQSLLAVAQQLHRSPVVAPLFQGRRGHPVGFQSGCGPALRALSGDQGARALLQQLAVTELELDDPGCIADVDTPELLRLAQELAG